MMRQITEAVGVPRTLVVPFGLGCPFGAPGDRDTRLRVIRALLDLCRRTDVPVLETFS